MHKTCTGWAGRPHGRPPESVCYLEMARSTGRSTARPLPIGGRPTGRPTFPTVRNPTVGSRPGDRPSAARAAELASNEQIFGAYKMGLPWAALDKIFGEFQSKFFLSIVEVISTYLSTKIVISKGEFSIVFCKRVFLEFFTTIIPCFSHTLELSITISIL